MNSASRCGRWLAITPSPQGATLWGTADKTSPEMAAFCNGVMVRVQDYNDTYFVSTDGAHPSDMIPALFAVAEAVRADGRSLIVATVTAYEIMCRFMQSVDVSARNYDQPLYASAATALAAGQLMGLSARELAHALALAVTPNLPLRQTRNGELSHWKGCATADGTRKAIFAANLASRGVTGPSDIFEGQANVVGAWRLRLGGNGRMAGDGNGAVDLSQEPPRLLSRASSRAGRHPAA
ncbi:MAG: MmgE/PrpD family protein [Betaproteobacteria bacterium]|nr:MmgE/PrpD family protein [Betaproteobacteria bacterium]